MLKNFLFTAVTVSLSVASAAAFSAGSTHSTPPSNARAEAHHHHEARGWMLSYRYMAMAMDGLLKNGDSVTLEHAAHESVALPSGPAHVRVVPQEMTTDMHMLGAMYTINARVTVTGMLNYLDKRMDLTTFAGMSGANVLGNFSTTSSGIGDTKLTVLIGLHQDPIHKIHLNLGASLPTGSIEENGTALTPMGTLKDIRLPYGMQLGSGTWDLEPGLTYGAYAGRWGWGGHYRAKLRLHNNDGGYRLGDHQEVAAWGSVNPMEWVTGNLRLTYTHEGDIDGEDAEITAPVTTADPTNYGGERVVLGAGLSFTPGGGLHGHRLELEYAAPLYQDLNGLQMDMHHMLSLSYRYAF